jgi:hypothetical protein
MGLVSTHQLSTFTTPVNGTSPIDANQVKGNDNSIKTSYNAHDADTTIHLQSGAVATRPAASTAGQTWLATDSGAVYLWLDNGSAWVEANYLRNTGGTVTGNVLITGTLGVTGATTLSSTLTIGGVTYTFPASQAANQYLRTDGSGTLTWVNVLESLALTDLSDVTITSVASGQFLLYDGAVWVNGTNGSALTTLNASNLSSGTVNTARVAGSYTGITAVGTLTAGAISTGFTAIADTFLATISTASKVSNSATTATNANTASAIVARDASGNFSAGTITASLTGNISGTAPAGTLTGTTLASNVVTSSLTSHGTLVSGAVPASLVTAGTFGAGAYTFPGALAITGALTGVTTLTASSTATIGAAESPLLIGRCADYTTYGAISFNGSLTSTTMNGLFGRLSPTDGGLYICAPSGSVTKVQVAGSTVATFAGALTTLATPLAISGAFTGATTGTFSGAITSTVGNNATVLSNTSATTGYQQIYFQNTSGGVRLGVNGSTAAALLTGGNAYAATLDNLGNYPLDFGTNGIRRGGFSAAGAFDLTSTLAVTGAATFSSTVSTGALTATTIVTTATAFPNASNWFKGYLDVGPNQSTSIAQGDISLGRSATSAYINMGSDALANLARSGGSGATVFTVNFNAVSIPGTLAVTGDVTGGSHASFGVSATIESTIALKGKSSTATSASYAFFCRDSADTGLFNVRGDGLVSVPGTLAVTGTTTLGKTGSTPNLLLKITTTGTGDIAPEVAGTIRFLNAAQNTVTLAIADAGVYSTAVGATNRDVYIDNTGVLGYVSSIRASKTNITPLTDTSWLDALTPVAFNYRKKDEDGAWTDEANTPLEYGLIAEDVEGVNAELVFYDETEDGLALRGVSYNKLMIPLLQRVQALTARNDALTARVAALEAV